MNIANTCSDLLSDVDVAGPDPDGVHAEGPAREEGDLHQRNGELPGQPPGPRHRDLPHNPPEPVREEIAGPSDEKPMRATAAAVAHRQSDAPRNDSPAGHRGYHRAAAHEGNQSDGAAQGGDTLPQGCQAKCIEKSEEVTREPVQENIGSAQVRRLCDVIQ